jgi:hypothetical protein
MNDEKFNSNLIVHIFGVVAISCSSARFHIMYKDFLQVTTRYGNIISYSYVSAMVSATGYFWFHYYRKISLSVRRISAKLFIRQSADSPAGKAFSVANGC